MDGTAAGYVVTVIPQPVAAGGGVAEAAEVVAAEVVAVVDSGPNKLNREGPIAGPFLMRSGAHW